jgi:5-methylcytosine-specific restriction endonuclease McrA
MSISRYSLDETDSLTRQALRPSAQTRGEVLYRWQGRCARCGVEEWRTTHRHHLLRLLSGARGGRYEVDNLIPLCSPCHLRLEREVADEIL